MTSHWVKPIVFPDGYTVIGISSVFPRVPGGSFEWLEVDSRWIEVNEAPGETHRIMCKEWSFL